MCDDGQCYICQNFESECLNLVEAVLDYRYSDLDSVPQTHLVDFVVSIYAYLVALDPEAYWEDRYLDYRERITGQW